ncbi:hypothetical protein GBAR_LOCUS27693 [Geodia barretti]|uniref:Uncharacterized protein n=1 Tax=Geodia barretti TaxID=519541 RepID=A0AA35TLE1_GEOBA|nr:hypothetical protein GBAR_LOCUS27693 [Geodia barretti]
MFSIDSKKDLVNGVTSLLKEGLTLGGAAPLAPVKGGINGCTDVVCSATHFVDCFSGLVDSTHKLGEKVTTLLDEGIRKVNSLKNAEIKYGSKARVVFEDVRLVARHAFDFVDKVDDIFWYGKDTEEAREALCDREDVEPLFELLAFLTYHINEADQQYAVFEECFKKANQSCLAAAKNCKQRRQEAKSKKMRTRIIGGTLSGGGLAGGVAIGVTATVVGVLTGGIGVPIVLGLGAAAGIGIVGAGAAVTTGGLAYSFGRAQKSFADLAKLFDSFWLATVDIKKEVDTIKDYVKKLNESRPDFADKRSCAAPSDYVGDAGQCSLVNNNTGHPSETMQALHPLFSEDHLQKCSLQDLYSEINTHPPDSYINSEMTGENSSFCSDDDITPVTATDASMNGTLNASGDVPYPINDNTCLPPVTHACQHFGYVADTTRTVVEPIRNGESCILLSTKSRQATPHVANSAPVHDVVVQGIELKACQRRYHQQRISRAQGKIYHQERISRAEGKMDQLRAIVGILLASVVELQIVELQFALLLVVEEWIE